MIVPVHNEENILVRALSRMFDEFQTLDVPFEIVACENGSTDGTFATLQSLARQHPQLHVERLAEADYGQALRHGVSVCKYARVIMVNIDFWDLEFIRTAIRKLETSDAVIGSKIMHGAIDERPFVRRAITRSFNAFLWACFDFHGTDTHGMKAMRKAAVMPILPSCASQGWIFDTELVIRAERAGLTIVEIPVNTREVRAPGYWSIAKRVPGVVANLARMFVSLRSGAK